MLWPDRELWPIPLGSTITPINWRLHLQKEMMIPLISHISYGFSQWMGQPILKSLGWRTTREQIDQPFKCLNFDKNKDTVYSLVVQVTVIRVQCTCIYIYIPRRTLGLFFLPSAPRQPHRHFHPEVCKTRQIYVCIFISKCFFVLRRHFVPRHFYPEVRRKTQNLGGKKRNSAEFCSKHVSALNNMKRPYKKLSASVFFWAFILRIGRNKRLQAG